MECKICWPKLIHLLRHHFVSVSFLEGQTAKENENAKIRRVFSSYIKLTIIYGTAALLSISNQKHFRQTLRKLESNHYLSPLKVAGHPQQHRHNTKRLENWIISNSSFAK